MKRLHLCTLIFIVATIFSFVLAVTLISGCSLDSTVKVETGDYVPLDTGSIHEMPAAELIIVMRIDRENNGMELLLKNGSVISQSFAARPKQDWPSGCPANFRSTRMEILDIEVSELVMGDTTIKKPILVRNCPGDPERVILREDGQIGGAGTACAQNDKCIHFKPLPISSNTSR